MLNSEQFKFQREAQKQEHYWIEIVERLSKERGKVLDPIEIKAIAILTALEIPLGPYSAIELSRTEESIKKDRVIAEYITNKPPKLIEVETYDGKRIEIPSFDIRDIYPDGLPSELREVLNEETLNYLEIEYKHQKESKRLTNNMIKVNRELSFQMGEPHLHYTRLPGGVDLIMHGYFHDFIWQIINGGHLKENNKYPAIICIETHSKLPYGKTLDAYWNDPHYQLGHYDVLMKEAVEEGFDGLFTEVDPRAAVHIDIDEIIDELPDDFFREYFKYLKKNVPTLANKIENESRERNIDHLKLLKELLSLQSFPKVVEKQISALSLETGKTYFIVPYITQEGEISLEPTFFELGRLFFADALTAIRLHLIARLMNVGAIKKGLIVDYEGAGHLYSKTFFLNYPLYAMEVVLRMIHYLKEGEIKKIPQVYEIFRNIDNETIIREITKLALRTPSLDRSKLEKVEIDVLKILGIDPTKVVPSDEEIKRMRKRFERKLNK